MSQLVSPFGKGSLDSNAPTGETGKGMDKDDIQNLFDADDKPEVKEPKTPVKEDDDVDDVDDKKDEDDDEEIKLKEDVEDEDNEEKLDLKKEPDTDDKLVTPPKIKDITAKYPNFFKEFPFLEKMMFRDKAYTELFGSFDDAKEVAGKVERLNEFETQLLSGDTKEVLSTVKVTDSEAFDKIVDNYLAALESVDKDAYHEVVGNFSKRVIMGMVDEARRTNDEDLKTAAEQFYKYLFGTTKWEEPKVRVKAERSEEGDKLKTERLQFTQERFETARGDLQTKVDNVLRATISEHIDPKGSMSAYEKKNAVKDALDLLHNDIRADDVFVKNLDKLWRASFGDKFSNSSLDKIRKTYLGKAQGRLASIIKKVRAEALKDKDLTSSKKEEKEEDEEEDKTPVVRKTGKINAGRPTQQTPKAKDRQKGESIEEFFARD